MKKHSYAIPLVIVLIVMAGAISLGSCLGDRHDAKMAASADSLYYRLDADSVPFMADVSRDARFMIRTTDSTTYFCDSHYTNIPTSTTLRGVLFGGRASYGANAGFACAYSRNAPSAANARIGSRLCFIPA